VSCGCSCVAVAVCSGWGLRQCMRALAVCEWVWQRLWSLLTPMCCHRVLCQRAVQEAGPPVPHLLSSTCRVLLNAAPDCRLPRPAAPAHHAHLCLHTPSFFLLPLCRAFPDAFTVRCFAFEPSDEQIQEDRKGQRNFIMFPPGECLGGCLSCGWAVGLVEVKSSQSAFACALIARALLLLLLLPFSLSLPLLSGNTL
jgi:hypothetical protein